jgi:tetratricopeptide (TPR) repeat protein
VIARTEYSRSTGDFDDAIRIAEENRNASPDASLPHLLLAFGYAAAGDPEKAREIVDAAQRTFGEERLPNATLGHIHATLGEMDEAFRAYERGFDNREWLMTWLRVNPYAYENLAPLRQDPRYWDLMRRMNFPPFPREHPGYAEEQAQQARRP